MPLGTESIAVQRPFIGHAIEAGWTYLSPEEALNLRRGITSPIVDSVLIEQLRRLNPATVDLQRAEDAAKKLVRVRANVEGNLDAWEYLKGLKTVFVKAERQERNIRLLDPSNVGKNKFHVTDEFTFSNGTPPDIRTDITFFINGIPIIVTETKAASHMEGIAEAFDDIRYYHQKAPEFLALAQLHALTHLIQFFYGATWNLSRKGLFNWRDEQAGICFVAAPRRCTLASPASRRLASARPALAPKCKRYSLTGPYLDKYSIRESVADGTTVPLHYSLAPNHLQVDRETLEREFLGLKELEGVSDIEKLNKVLERAVTLRNMLKNRKRVDEGDSGRQELAAEDSQARPGTRGDHRH